MTAPSEEEIRTIYETHVLQIVERLRQPLDQAMTGYEMGETPRRLVSVALLQALVGLAIGQAMNEKVPNPVILEVLDRSKDMLEKQPAPDLEINRSGS